MYCTACGYFIKCGCKFCGNCGEIVRESPLSENPDVLDDVLIETQTPELPEPSELPELPELPMPVEPPPLLPPPPPPPVLHAPLPPPMPPMYFAPPPPPMRFNPPKKEKVVFGKGAFAFCLSIIAVLSIIGGVFIGLYVNERSKNNSRITDERGTVSYYSQNR
ncbi:MAG: hypothetical protein FWD34_08240 [Oscillospiraceae bacterium]|nr:hypothetical protein [Oscillospiraceae bacterium]